MTQEVLNGLARPSKILPSKYFYDARGSELFERICELPEYYVTRTELGIMTASIDDIVAALGSKIRLVEYGSGAGIKVQLLLDHLDSPTSYVPVEISADMLAQTARQLRRLYPRLPIEPLAVDYTRPFSLPKELAGTSRTVCYYPGSTIGNFNRNAAEAFLRNIARTCGPGGRLGRSCRSAAA